MTFRLAGFISASLLAHLLLLGAGVDSTAPKIGGMAETLQVTLMRAPQPTVQTAVPQQRSAASQPTHTPPAQPLIAAHHQHRLVPKVQPQPVAIAAAPLDVPPPSAAPASQPAAPNASTSAAASLQASKQISAALQNQLAEHFFYPWLARKRGWQGRVMLSLHIGGNGHLTHWKVARTSGHQVLDRSALDSARRIHSLPEATSLLNGTALDLLVPVYYRLLDSQG